MEKTGEAVILDLGSRAGLAVNMQFDVFADAEIITAPGTTQEVFRSAYVIARIITTEVQADRARARVFEKLDAYAKIKAGLAVVRTAIETVINTPPDVKSARLKPDKPHAGDVVEIELEVIDIEKDVVNYKWEAGDGAFPDVPATGSGQATTLGPRIRWICPQEAGPVTCSVEATDAAQQKAKLTFKIPAQGRPPVASVERLLADAAFAGGSRHFAQADDLAFDPDGNAYVLDTNLHKVVCLRPDFSIAWATKEYNPEWRPVRIAVTRESLFLLDAHDRDVMEFRARREMFDGPPERVYGAPGSRGLRLRRPVALALGPKGAIYVADAELGIVQRFDREAEAQVQIGAKGEGKGQFLDLSGVAATAPDFVWALDRARKKVAVYDGLKLVEEMDAVGSGDTPVALGTLGNAVYVLGENRIWALDVGAAPREVLAVRGRQFWTLAGAGGLAGDCFGFLVVTGAGGKSLLRFRGGRFKGQWGGMDFSGATRLAVNNTGEMALWSPSEGLLWKFDRQGWIVDWKSVGDMQVRDIALAGDGGLWILEAATNRLVLASAGTTPGPTAIALATHRVAGAVAIAGGGEQIHVLDRKAALWIHTFSTVNGRPEGSTLLTGSRPEDAARLSVGADGTRCVWTDGGACRVYDADGRALPPPAFGDGTAVAGAVPGDGGAVFGAASHEPAVALARPRGEGALRFGGEGRFGSAADLAGDGFRRLYLLESGTGRVLRLAP